MIRAALFSIFGCLIMAIAEPALANTNPIGPVLANSENFTVICLPEVPGCGSGDNPAALKQIKPLASAIASEAERVKQWFADLGYPELQLSRKGGKMMLIVVPQADKTCGPNSIACHKEEFTTCGTLIMCRLIFLPYDNLRTGKIGRRTLAHELFHALAKVPDLVKPISWLEEALAQSVGDAWARKNGEKVPAGFVLSLDRPFYDGEDDGYEKSEYFLLLGKRLGSVDNVQYINKFFPLKNDGENGMSFPYEKVPSYSFDKLFPEYVALHNSMASDFEAGTLGDYYDKYEKKSIRISDPTSGDFEDFKFSVQQFAAEPIHFTKIEMSKKSEEDPKDLLMVAQFEIRAAQRPEDLTLVFENIVSENARHTYLFSGNDPIDGGFVRVTNAAATTRDTSPQDFTLRFQHRPVQFKLPTCVVAGSNTPIEVTGSLADAKNWKIKSSTGRVDGLIFHAPSSHGEAKITLEISTHITRAREERSVKTPDVLEVVLGKITIAAKACDIRMEFVGESVSATYSSSEDFTKYNSPDGANLYIGEGRVAAFIPEEGGWTSLPPGYGQMFEGQMRIMVGAPSIIGTPRWAKPDVNMMRRMPLIFTQWYEWEGLINYLHPGAKKSTLGTKTPCPAGETGCLKITFEGQGVGSATYNEQRQLVELEGGGKVVRFTYGGGDMFLPPGW